MACGDEAKPIYDLMDDLAGGDDERPAKALILTELILWVSGDTVRAFTDDFRRNHEFPHGGEPMEDE